MERGSDLLPGGIACGLVRKSVNNSLLISEIDWKKTLGLSTKTL